jgi:hypothetical protein
VATFLKTWQSQIAEMQRLVALWDILKTGNQKTISQHVHWRMEPGGPEVTFESHWPRSACDGLGPVPFTDVIAATSVHEKSFGLFKGPKDVVTPGWVYLRREIDRHLQGAQIAAGASWDTREGRPALRLEAQTLLSGAWLQFAEAVASDRHFERCRECGELIVVHPDVARSHRRFCSDACRMKAYRQRQDRARQMFAAKKTYAQIAKELDSDIGTVRRWITGSKE